MRAWIEDVDSQHEAIIHAVDKSQLDIIAEHCKSMHNDGHVQTGDGDKLCMSADGFTIMAWCNTHGITWKEFFRDQAIQKRFIEDPDNSAFRIWKGRL
jgi:hypothetical protein